jgi:hypothetical protein
MSKSSAASKIAKKLTSRGGIEDAQQILAKYDNVEDAVKLKGAERKEYLEALDAVYGDRDKRAKDLGFGDKTYYHGTRYLDGDIESFSPKVQDEAMGENIWGKGTYVSNDPKTASGYTGGVKIGRSGGVYPLKVRGEVQDLDSVGGKVDHKINQGAEIRTGIENAVIRDPKDIRSTNAAFDPRFKDSANILALNGAAPKIAARLAKPQMNLGDAFSAITEPIEKLDAPANALIDSASKKFGQLTDLTGGKDKDHQERAGTAFNIAASMVAPTPSNVMLGGVGKVAKVAKTVKPVVQKSAAEIYRDAKAGMKANGFGTVVVKDSPAPLGTVTVKP